MKKLNRAKQQLEIAADKWLIEIGGDLNAKKELEKILREDNKNFEHTLVERRYMIREDKEQPKTKSWVKFQQNNFGKRGK